MAQSPIPYSQSLVIHPIPIPTPIPILSCYTARSRLMTAAMAPFPFPTECPTVSIQYASSHNHTIIPILPYFLEFSCVFFFNPDTNPVTGCFARFCPPTHLSYSRFFFFSCLPKRQVSLQPINASSLSPWLAFSVLCHKDICLSVSLRTHFLTWLGRGLAPRTTRATHILPYCTVVDKLNK